MARIHGLWILTALFCALAVGCGGDDVSNPGEDNEEELITTVELTFTPAGGGVAVVASFADPDGDGGDPPVIDDIELVSGTTYDLSIGFLNELASPVEDIGEEVAEEAEEHQIFITGDVVDGPATSNTGVPVVHSYADVESDYGSNAAGDDLPVGLVNEIDAVGPGMGTFRVTLRHLPEINGTPQKTPDAASTAAAGGIAALPGESDADPRFTLTVIAP